MKTIKKTFSFHAYGQFNSQLPGQLGKPVSECQTVLDFVAAAIDDENGGAGEKLDS